MKQKINLLNALPKRQRDYFSVLILLKALGIFFVLLLIIYIFAYWNVNKLAKKVDLLKSKHAIATKELVELTEKYPTAANVSKLEKEMASLEKHVCAREKLVSVLKKEGAFNTKGFSPFLIGFAKNIAPGIWLTKIDLNEGGDAIEITGKALNPQLVLAYVKQLNSSSEFEGVTFKVGSLQKSTEEKEIVQFILQGIAKEQNA